MEAFRTHLCLFLLLLTTLRGETKPNDPSKLEDPKHMLQWPINPLTGEVIFDRCLSENRDPSLAARLSGGPYIPFPLPRPTPNNIFAVCQYGNHRPRYTKEMLPNNAYGDILRQASAINQLESWLSMCCRSHLTSEDLTLCCAKQAWEKSLSVYCEKESQIKTLQPFCCCQPEPEKWACFEREASRLSYQPSSQGSPTILTSTVEGFNFDPATCQKTSILEVRPSQTTNINSTKKAHMLKQTFVLPVIPVTVRQKEPRAFLQQPVESSPFLQQPVAKSKGLVDRVHRPVLEDTGSSRTPLARRFFPTSPTISFPLARPNSGNVPAICQYGNHRPRYPKEILPHTGFGYLYRQASAITQLESWFAFCCAQDEELIMCCTEQAWEMSLSTFCNEEFGIKTSHYPCCLRHGSERWECFKNDAPNKLYLPSDDEQWDRIPFAVQSFNFNSDICLKTRVPGLTPRSLKAEKGFLNISFPPGRPNSLNIESICDNQKQRAQYASECLLSMGYKWLSHKYKAIDNLEKAFGQCCMKNKNVLTCAEKVWKGMVSNFCRGDQKSELMQFDCCNQDRGENQYSCFASAAPNPDYILGDNTTQPETQPTLNMLCDTNISLLKISMLPLNIDKITERCCALVEEQRHACIQTQLGDVHDHQLLLNIAKVNRIISNNPRNCPISF